MIAGVKRIVTMVIAAAVLLAALHVVIAHDLVSFDRQTVVSSAESGEHSPTDSDSGKDDHRCSYCQVVTHAVEILPAISVVFVARPILTPSHFQHPRSVVAALRLRPPRAS